ncbi:MAG: outer membrane beta-barrel protein [Gammaproteobacteria bacterium]
MNYFLKRALITTWLLVAAPALAIDLDDEDLQAIQPSIGLQAVYDSNIFDSSSDEIDSLITIVAPTLLLSTAPAPRRFALLYTGEYGYYLSSSDDNYDDHLLSGLGTLTMGSRGRLDLTASTQKAHRDRGSNQTDGFGPGSLLFPDEPDQFDRSTWSTKFRYGADGNRGRLNFGIGGTQLDYTNNKARTRFFDFETLSGSAGLSLRFHQRTSVVFTAAYTNINYENARQGAAIRDGHDWRYLLGLTWEATSKTSGSVRLGIQQRSFDDPSRDDTSNPSWEVDVRWSPRDYSHVDFVASRVNQETFGEGAFIDSRLLKVSWTHEWNRGWESVVSFNARRLEFVDSARDQDSHELYIGLRLPQTRLLTWETGYRYRTRDSSVDRYVFTGNMFSIGFNLGT